MLSRENQSYCVRYAKHMSRHVRLTRSRYDVMDIQGRGFCRHETKGVLPSIKTVQSPIGPDPNSMATFSYLMPVPAISSLIESTDFSKTVLSYLPQLYDFPTQVYHSLGSLEALRSLYLTTNPFISGLSFCLLTAPLFFLAGEINRNYSQVDRFWSILPTLYNAHYAVYAHTVGIPTERLDLLLIASFLWSVRVSGSRIALGFKLTDHVEVTIELQLLAQRGIQQRLRGLSLGSPSQVYQSAAIRHFRCRLHIAPPKCEYSHLFDQIYLHSSRPQAGIGFGRLSRPPSRDGLLDYEHASSYSLSFVSLIPSC